MKRLLTDAQLQAEINRCEYCENKPCRDSSPTNISPTDFIMAAKCGKKSDYKRAATLILSRHPFGGIGGIISSPTHCMRTCVHNSFDIPINIHGIQATIIQKANKLNALPKVNPKRNTKKKIVIIGAGPAGLSTAFFLAREGHSIEVFEKNSKPCPLLRTYIKNSNHLKILDSDIKQILSLKNINLFLNQEISDIKSLLNHYDAICIATGYLTSSQTSKNKKIFFAGDCLNEKTTLDDAVASAQKTANAIQVLLTNHPLSFEEELPVSLQSSFFDQAINSPFILSASPLTDSYEQIKKAYQAGWAGAVLKTVVTHENVHIPSQYLFLYDDETYGNCDNFSRNSMQKTCQDIRKLIKEFPDQLTLASTSGPMTGNDKSDKKIWQHNTIKLENAGAMGIEYSLSCPQGNDPTSRLMVAQSIELTTKVIEWIMEISNPEIPKLFKLTPAVTSIKEIVSAIEKTLHSYPNKKAGITLANSFPTLAFRENPKQKWDDGIITGMSGRSIEHISYLSIADIANNNISISGNGGMMNYYDAANLLALGAKTIQFCTLPMKQGLNIIHELKSGLSYLLEEKNISSIDKLIKLKGKKPIKDFLSLSDQKCIAVVNPERCEHCGNCTRCPYQAITLDENKTPVIDSKKCVGCKQCVNNCFAKALRMTPIK